MAILIVDDEEVALSSLKRLLKHKGFREVAVCNNGAEANGIFDQIVVRLQRPTRGEGQRLGLQLCHGPVGCHRDFDRVPDVRDSHP